MERLSLCFLVRNVPKSGLAPTLRQLFLQYFKALLGTCGVIGFVTTVHMVFAVGNYVFRDDEQGAAYDVALHFEGFLNEWRLAIEVVAAASELGRIKEDANATPLPSSHLGNFASIFLDWLFAGKGLLSSLLERSPVGSECRQPTLFR